MYVGPTSQYPRVDEARVDALYELELAFSQLPPAGESCPPVHPRRPLPQPPRRRHRQHPPGRVLHRQDVSARGFTGLRLGLLELRAFEMAPHYRMGLLRDAAHPRASSALFWKQPFDRQPASAGEPPCTTASCCPEFVLRDFAEVLGYLRSNALASPSKSKWYATRIASSASPKIGSVSVRRRRTRTPSSPRTLERSRRGDDLRRHRPQRRLVPGTHPDQAHRRRWVERQVVTDSRYSRRVQQGRRVPLRPHRLSPAKLIAGIRYRARRLSAALHPTIPVHTPLTFDLIDTCEAALRRPLHLPRQPTRRQRIYTTRPTNAAEATGPPSRALRGQPTPSTRAD